MDVTLRQLRDLSPLLVNTSVLRLGSAYEGTYISQLADFDAFLELNDSLLEVFQLERHEDGHVAAHLLPNVSQGMLSEELQQLLTEDGYLDARRVKRWTLDGLARAVERAAAEFPELTVAVTERQNVVGVRLRSEDAVVRVDFSAMIRTPLGWRALRPAALRPCGVELRPRDRPARWHLFSRQDLKSPPPSDSSARLFAPDPLTVEQEVLQRLPLVRRATRLLKMVAAARRWDIRFSLQSVVLKRAALKAFDALCDQRRPAPTLLSLVVSSLEILQRSVQRGMFSCFWIETPLNRLLEGLAEDQSKKQQLAAELNELAQIFSAARVEDIRLLFQMTCQNSPFRNHKSTFD
ncbi:uncharacterized protein LOC122370278 [Amphibalanus amphitrite]|uniref:uncharacterized protein LOC122370278 n=1 Tax=Amphibalanus amphitrite TaxID=1232801 RepID=UPI001C916C00|nr:uncharacterized protein LOC122370278 [Amphibalanus amphitrite]